ncbi:DUF5956 family protein [Paeniglutamicibacter cryotolerans]|uniref:DUF5956 family protein n=1 Tax=Paeniglutamicibacter cryotolerans TaxID=670079 RepID=UPI0038992B45
MDRYLSRSGLPSRPRGYRCFLCFPAGIKDKNNFWGHLNEADFQMPDTHRDPKREAANLGETIKGSLSQMR